MNPFDNFTPVSNPEITKPSLDAMKSKRSPRTTEEMRAAAASLTDLSLEALEQVIRHAEKDSDRIAAAIALLDRGHGKPIQQVAMRPSDGNVIDALYREVFGNIEVIEGNVIADISEGANAVNCETLIDM